MRNRKRRRCRRDTRSYPWKKKSSFPSILHRYIFFSQERKCGIVVMCWSPRLFFLNSLWYCDEIGLLNHCHVGYLFHLLISFFTRFLLKQMSVNFTMSSRFFKHSKKLQKNLTNFCARTKKVLKSSK